MLRNRAVIQKVLDRLEEWVNRNPMKLNKAAKSCPMEGRNHSDAGWTRLTGEQQTPSGVRDVFWQQ